MRFSLAASLLLASASVTAADEAVLGYAPAKGCEAVLDGYCNLEKAACKICRGVKKYARYDMGLHKATDGGKDVKRWRCYCEQSLNSDNSMWVNVPVTKSITARDYCTRHEKLERLLDDCISGRISKSGYEVKEL